MYVSPVSEACFEQEVFVNILCTEAATLEDYPSVNTIVYLEYINTFEDEVYIPIGANNQFTGDAQVVGHQPVVFETGFNTFEVYTDGGSFEWELITPGCTEPSATGNAQDATDCNVPEFSKLPSSVNPSTTNDSEFWEARLYPNPTNGNTWLQLDNVEGNIEVEVMSSIGQLLSRNVYNVYSGDRIQLDVNTIDSRVLFVKVSYDSEVKVLRLLKN
ncbi:MAG: T9SS type A sorting domain-containing protein [Bacteroidota bacterium]